MKLFTINSKNHLGLIKEVHISKVVRLLFQESTWYEKEKHTSTPGASAHQALAPGTQKC